MKIRAVRSDDEIKSCFPVLRQLRSHLTEETFVDQVRRQIHNHGYSLICIEETGTVRAAAGYRVVEYLAWGRTFYVDDLITGVADRGRGFGSALMDWLMEKALEMGCAEFHLDSGVQRYDAHRLYLNKKMNITSHHFSKTITGM